jgi:hypothetical protein
MVSGRLASNTSLAQSQQTSMSLPAHNALDAIDDRRLEQVVGPQYVGPDRLDLIEFTGRHLLERGRVEHVVDIAAGIDDRAVIVHVAEVVANLLAKHAALIVLLFSSRLKTRTSRMLVCRKRRNTALSNEPVPPLMSNVLSSNMSLSARQCAVIVAFRTAAGTRLPIARCQAALICRPAPLHLPSQFLCGDPGG